MECAMLARRLLEPDGVVVFHDWNHPRYQPLRELFKVVEESKEFLVLRGDPANKSPRPD